MKQILQNPYNFIHQKFTKSFKWTLSGSIVYESFKVLHCFLLLKALPANVYGAMGSLFSLIYLVTYIADLGATNSLPPFLPHIAKSRSRMKQFMLTYSLMPHLPISILCALGATYFAHANLQLKPFIIIIPLIIVLETIRSFLRMFLHTIFYAKHAVIAELIIFFTYTAVIWLPHLVLNQPITLNSIFIPHLLDSVITVVLFLGFAYRYYQTLPTTPQTEPLSPTLTKRIIVTRLFNYLLRVTRNMFTSNFLTPMFAIKFGLKSAGFFYFASVLANATQAIVKSAIGYSGNALMANLKDSPQQVKKEAFALLSQRLVAILAPIIILIACNYRGIIRLSATHSTTQYTLALSLLFLLISFTEFFFILYEQFYVIEEAANKLFFFKILELAAFYSVISSDAITNPVNTLLSIITIRLISLTCIAINAWILWKISLNISTNKKYLLAWLGIALIIAAYIG